MRRTAFRFIVALVVAVVLAAPAGPQTAHAATGPLCYVDIDATSGGNDGNSWASAYIDLQSALNNYVCTEIWVAEGLYKPGAERNSTFNVHAGMTVYGGFAGTETSRTQRDWNTNITVLSGDIDNDDTTDSDGIVQDYANIHGSNAYIVVYMDGISAAVTGTTVLDGFTITAGQANGGGIYTNGAGMYCNGAYSGGLCSPTLANLTFVGNDAQSTGGGLLNVGSNGGVSSPAISDSVFRNNHADQGGAICNNGYAGTANPTLLRVTFSYNSATGGGAVYNWGGSHGTSSPSFAQVTFDHNSAANGAGGAVYNDGQGGHSNPTFLKATFSYNSALYNGGAVSNDGSYLGESNPSFTGAYFDHNTANYGGAIYSNATNSGVSSPSLSRVTFTGNGATGGYGGAMDNNGNSGTSSPTLYNVTFQGNTAAQGGGMYSDGSTGTSNAVLTNVTFSGNQAGSFAGGMYNLQSNPLLTNVILWDDTGGSGHNEIMNVGLAPTIRYSIVEGSGGSAAWDSSLGTDGGNNLDEDPLLGPLQDNGSVVGFTTYTMTLLWGSPAIDAGSDTYCRTPDERGIPRPKGDHCDMGAVERVPPGARSDFESDGVSDMAYFHPATGMWGILQSSEDFSYSSPRYYSWGASTDILAAGDYDGDGLWDPAVRTPPAGGQSAAYRILRSTTGYDFGSSLTIPAGWPGLGDTPVPGDFNGDGFMEPGIWRGNTGVWIIPLSPTFTSYAFYSWGASGDKPIAADVDGDGQSDIGYWRPSTGVWGFLVSSMGYSYASPTFFSWGASTDTPVMADYDGDGLADPAVVIPPAGGQSKAYRILLSTLAYDPAQSMTVPAGWPGLNDTPVPADRDGDGKADAGIWRANTGIWIIPKSSTNNTSYMFAAWGASGDLVVK
jgi:predicted outer membrane repeat protein